MATDDPFAAAGFAPAQNAQPAADPFGAAGFVAQQPAPQPPGVQAKLVSVDDYGTPTYDDPKLNSDIRGGAGRALEKVGEGATFGLLPFAAAGVKTLVNGAPYSQNLQSARDYTAETSKISPLGSMLAEGAGSIIPTIAGGVIGAPIVKGAQVLGKVGPWIARTLGGGLLGGGSAAGHDIGSGDTESLGSDTAKGAALGGTLSGASPLVGALMQSAPNMVRGATTAVRNITTGGGRDAVAGQVLREASGDFANGTARSPLPNLQLRTAQATGNPGIAALDRTLASEPGTRATAAGEIVQNGRTSNQTDALASSLVGNDARIEPTVLTNQASGRGVQAIQNSRDVLRQAENDLWNQPELTGVRLRAEPLVNGVNNDVAGMPPSFRMAFGQGGQLAGHMADVAAIPEGASIADVNAIRSRILGSARDARAAGDSVTATAAQGLADSLLNRTEGALGSAGAPIQEAYAAARDLTRQRAQAFGQPAFDSIFRPNAAGNMRGDANNVFGQFFDTANGSDRGPQQLQTVVSLLRATGQPEAHAAADELTGAAQDYLKAQILRQARAGNGLDATGQPSMNLATLSSAVNKTMPSVSGTPMMAPAAGDIQAAGNAAELLNRPSTLRGDSNSTTFEKLRNKDLVSAIVGQSGSSALGAAAGGYAAAEHGPEEVPWYLRVPGGMLAGALMGQKFGPAIGKTLSHIPGASSAMSGPSDDITRRLAAALADPAEYQRLMRTQIQSGPGLFDQGVMSRSIPSAARFAIPALTGEGGR